MNRAERRATAKQRPSPVPKPTPASVNWNERTREYARQQSMHDCGQLLKDVFTVLRDKFSFTDAQMAELTKGLNELR